MVAADIYRRPDDHLDDYLRHIYLCVARYLVRYGRRLIEATGTLNNLYVSLQEAEDTLRSAYDARGRPAALGNAMHLPELDDIEHEIESHLEHLSARTLASAALNPSLELPIEALSSNLDLTPEHVRILIAAAAPHLSIDLSRVFTFAWADFKISRPTVGFLTELLGSSRYEQRALLHAFRFDSPLCRHRLLEIGESNRWGRQPPLLHASVNVPDRVIDFLLGQLGPLPLRLSQHVLLMTPQSVARPAAELALPETALKTLERALEGKAGQTGAPREMPPRLLLVGPGGAGRRTALHAVAAQWGRPLLCVSLNDLDSTKGIPALLDDVVGEATLRGAALLLRCESLTREDSALEKVVPYLRHTLTHFRGVVALTTHDPSPLLHAELGNLLEVPIPMPSSKTQRALWHEVLQSSGCHYDEDIPEVMTQRLALTPGQIHRAVANARQHDALIHPDADSVRLSVSALTHEVRSQIQHKLRRVCRLIDVKHTWDDLVLPQDTMRKVHEILLYAKHHETVFDVWGMDAKMPYGKGLSCLFSGPPGTGKTMVAGLIARSLGRELYRVDLSRVVSKWVGETEKNLGLAFDEAEKGQVVLLFDEADSLFSKRSKGDTAQDRSGNMEINYLLQRMEEFRGVTVLTTNNEQAMDDAFARRLKFRITIPMPDAEHRARLWKSMLPPFARIESGIDFEHLGQDFEMGGGHILNAVLRASMYAAEARSAITTDELWEAATAELREMGKIVRDWS